MAAELKMSQQDAHDNKLLQRTVEQLEDELEVCRPLTRSPVSYYFTGGRSYEIVEWPPAHGAAVTGLGTQAITSRCRCDTDTNSKSRCT
jgi:hypothetical protein